MAYVNELSGSKLRAKLGSQMNESATAPSFSTFAQNQLEKMGWKEGGGLGKDGSGMATHIRVKKREEEVGIGHEKKIAVAAADTWWSSSLEETLARLHSKKDGKTKKKKKKEKEKEKQKKKTRRPPTDEELFAATGGARFGMRAQRRAEGKWKRTELCPDLKKSENEVVMEWNGLGKAKIVSNRVIETRYNEKSNVSIENSKSKVESSPECPSFAVNSALPEVGAVADSMDMCIPEEKSRKSKKRKHEGKDKKTEKKKKKSKKKMK